MLLVKRFQKLHPLLVIILLVFWANQSNAEPQYGGTLIYRAPDKVQNLDPPLIEDSVSYNIAGNIFEGLVRYKGETAIIEPALATSWDVSKDGLRWTFNLRKNVTFHDNTPLNAEAVLFSFLRQMDEKHPFYSKDFLYKDVVFSYVESLKSLDENTIQFILSQPYSPFLHLLTMPPAAIVSPDAVKKSPKDFGSKPVGSGPFRVVEWTDRDLVLEPFHEYWGGRPYLGRVVIQPAKFLKTMLLSMRQGNLHLAEGVTPRELLWVKGDSEIVVKQMSTNAVKFIMFNMRRKAMSKLKVRQALQHVINKDGLVRWLWQGNSIAVTSPIPHHSWGFKKIKHPEYNLEKARVLLKDAGYANGLTLDFVVLKTRDPSWPRFFDSFVANCKEVGIKINLKSLPAKVYVKSHMKTADYDLLWVGWSGDHADPDNFIFPLLHSKNATVGSLSNLAYYQNPTMDKLIEEAQKIPEMEKRQKLYYQIQDMLSKEVPWIPILVPQNSYLHHRTVHNVMVSVIGRVQLEKMWLGE